MSVRTAASDHSFVAGPELPAEPFVVRVSGTPLTVTFVVAFTTVVPGVAEVRLAVQLPVAPTVAHGLPEIEPGPDAIENEICVPAGALTKPAPLPRFTSTWPVNTCAAPTGFIPFGVIEIRASTNVFTAGPLFGATPFVDTTTGWPPIVTVAVAVPVTCPAVWEVNVTWN
jgi:hypothetical protein